MQSYAFHYTPFVTETPGMPLQHFDGGFAHAVLGAVLFDTP